MNLKQKLEKAYRQISPVHSRKISHSLSPYSDKLEETLDPKVKNLVLSLIEKNYLTLTSCEGHSLNEGRDIVVAFPYYSQVLFFQTEIRRSGIPVTFTHYKDPALFMNASLELDEEGNIEDLVEKKGTTEAAVLSLNEMFLRKYENYHLLQVHLSKEGLGIKSVIYKKLFLEKNTEKLVKYIESNKFPAYEM